MNKKNTIEVCFSPASFPLFSDESAIVVVIDILRATSAICTALYHGVEKIIPVATVEEAVKYKSEGYIVAAERHGEIVEGFELGNSPYSYMDKELKGKTIVLTTTNGTQAIAVSKDAAKVVIGSFLNLDVLSQWLSEQKKNVILLCAGWKNRFNLEDTVFAGAVTEQLLATNKMDTNCDSTRAAQHLYQLAKGNLSAFLENSSHRLRLKKLNLEKDIHYCLTPNQAPVIPILRSGSLVKLHDTCVQVY